MCIHIRYILLYSLFSTQSHHLDDAAHIHDDKMETKKINRRNKNDLYNISVAGFVAIVIGYLFQFLNVNLHVWGTLILFLIMLMYFKSYNKK